MTVDITVLCSYYINSSFAPPSFNRSK